MKAIRHHWRSLHDAHLERLTERHGPLILAQPRIIQVFSHLRLVDRLRFLIPCSLYDCHAPVLPIGKVGRNVNSRLFYLRRVEGLGIPLTLTLFLGDKRFGIP